MPDAYRLFTAMQRMQPPGPGSNRPSLGMSMTPAANAPGAVAPASPSPRNNAALMAPPPDYHSLVGLTKRSQNLDEDSGCGWRQDARPLRPLYEALEVRMRAFLPAAIGDATLVVQDNLRSPRSPVLRSQRLVGAPEVCPASPSTTMHHVPETLTVMTMVEWEEWEEALTKLPIEERGCYYAGCATLEGEVNAELELNKFAVTALLL